MTPCKEEVLHYEFVFMTTLYVMYEVNLYGTNIMVITNALLKYC